MSKFIVSANYRNSPYKYLVRGFDEPIENAIAYRSVKAKGVQFCQSSNGEQGFGCRVVALCDECEPHDTEVTEPVIDGTKKLRFTGVKFVQVDDPNYVEVTSAKEIQLTEYGSVLAVL